MRGRPIAFVLAGAALALALAPHASAQSISKAECAAAFEKGQVLQLDGKLLEARERYSTCSQEACPDLVKSECVKAADKLRSAIPTVVIAVKDDSGVERTDVEVSVDGEPMPDALDGRAKELDPGTHVLRFEAEGAATLERTITVREGQSRKVVEVTLVPAGGGSAPPPGAAADTTGSDKTLAYVLGGVGVVGIAGFALFALQGKSKQSDLDEQGCKPKCETEEVDEVRQSFLIADVALGIGLVSLGVATYLYLKDEPPSEQAARPPIQVDVVGSRRGGAAVVRGHF